MCIYLYDINNKTLVYDKTTKAYLSFSLTNIHSLDFRKAIDDKNGCTLYLHEHWSDKRFMGYCSKRMIETGRISHVEYVYGVKTSSPEDFGKDSDKEKNISPIKCLRIQLADKPQSEVLIKGKDCNEFFPVPYDVIRENYVLSPERYPSKEELVFEGETEPMSKHISIVEYTGNSPDILTEIQYSLIGIDGLPPVIEKPDWPKYALKIDLNYWLPEGVLHRWHTYYKTIMFGTAPGLEGLECRLKHFVNLILPPPPPLIDQINSADYFTSLMNFTKEIVKLRLGEPNLLNSMLRDNYANTIERNLTIDFGDAFDSPEGEEKEKEIKAKLALLDLRRKIDDSLIDIFQQQENVSLKTLLKLSDQLKSVLSVNEEEERKYSFWFHDIDFDDIKKIISILDVIVKTKELLSGDCSATLEEACPDCIKIMKSDDLSLEKGFLPNVWYMLSRGILSSYVDHYAIKHNATEERQNVLYEMSHHIKNLVVSVIDPLENLSGKVPEDEQFVLDTAIKGANMIRQIVFFITNSYRSSSEDFLYDLSNPTDPPLTLGSLFENMLRASIASMFDKQTHEKFMKKFYKTFENFEQARKEWYETKNLSDIIEFMRDRMNIDKVKIDFNSYQDIVVGNEKGSATNLMILFNELTMNMLKALAFVPENERSFSVVLKTEDDKLLFIFGNSTRNVLAASKGYGKTIVANIANGFGGKIQYKPGDHYFEAELRLPFPKDKLEKQGAPK